MLKGINGYVVRVFHKDGTQEEHVFPDLYIDIDDNVSKETIGDWVKNVVDSTNVLKKGFEGKGYVNFDLIRKAQHIAFLGAVEDRKQDDR